LHGAWLFVKRLFTVFHSTIRQMPGQYFKLDHNCFFHILSNSLLTNQCYRIITIESITK
jgi:hypothetical protein